MPWRVVLAVLSGALLMAWWNVSARAEPMLPSLVAPTDQPAFPVAGSAAVDPLAATPHQAQPPAPTVAFPYRASITTDAAAIRSGPGEEYYETSSLRHGDEVEVYRHDPHGWCAIRPPPGSFSYVPAEHLKPIEDDVAETTVAGVKSFAGSSVGDRRDRSHVSLRRGERVVLLEKKPAEGLCKITPPAGEFRWVDQKCLERVGSAADAGSSASAPPDPPGTSAALSKPDQWRAAPRTTAFHGPEDAGGNDDGSSTTNRGDGATRSLAAGDNRPRTPTKPRRSMPPQRGWVRPSSAITEEDDPPAAGTSPAPAGQPTTPSQSFEGSATTGTTVARGDDALLNDALDQMDLALSNMVCQPKNQWNLDPLRDAAKDVWRNADRPNEQARARRLLDRIAQFETVRRQSLGLPQPVIEDRPAAVVTAAVPQRPTAAERIEPDSAGRAPSAVAKPREGGEVVGTAAEQPAVPSPANSPLPPNWEDPRFDGTGRLVPLEKRGDSDPQFLLVDEQGVARYYVTPAPGVNLRSYRDRVVGITGLRAEDQDGGKPHLTALRVTVLPDATKRR